MTKERRGGGGVAQAPGRLAGMTSKAHEDFGVGDAGVGHLYFVRGIGRQPHEVIPAQCFVNK